MKNALRSEQAEGLSDKVLDAVQGAVDKATGGKYSDQLKGARDQADKHIGKVVGPGGDDRGHDAQAHGDHGVAGHGGHAAHGAPDQEHDGGPHHGDGSGKHKA